MAESAGRPSRSIIPRRTWLQGHAVNVALVVSLMSAMGLYFLRGLYLLGFGKLPDFVAVTLFIPFLLTLDTRWNRLVSLCSLGFSLLDYPSVPLLGLVIVAVPFGLWNYTRRSLWEKAFLACVSLLTTLSILQTLSDFEFK